MNVLLSVAEETCLLRGITCWVQGDRVLTCRVACLCYAGGGGRGPPIHPRISRVSLAGCGFPS